MSPARRLFPVLCILALAGCSSSSGRAPTTDLTGFLNDYSSLQSGAHGTDFAVYQMEGAQWSNYDRVYLDAIPIWRGAESREGGVSQEDLQLLADAFYTAIYVKLSRFFEMAETPGGNTLRVKVAYTKIQETDRVIDVQSTRKAQPNLAPQVRRLDKPVPAMVGAATMEAVVTDAQTDVVLWAGIERRSDDTAEVVAFTWDDVMTDLEYDADMLAFHLCNAYQRKDCIRPAR